MSYYNPLWMNKLLQLTSSCPIPSFSIFWMAFGCFLSTTDSTHFCLTAVTAFGVTKFIIGMGPHPSNSQDCSTLLLSYFRKTAISSSLFSSPSHQTLSWCFLRSSSWVYLTFNLLWWVTWFSSPTWYLATLRLVSLHLSLQLNLIVTHTFHSTTGHH